MKKRLFFLMVVISLFSFSSCSVDEVKKSDLMNYKMAEIQPLGYYIDEVSDISSKLIRIHNGKVGVDRRYGFIDSLGNVVVEPQYLNAFIFSEGLAFVIDENKRGTYIDNSGSVVIENVENQNIGFGDIFKSGYATVRTYDNEKNKDIAAIINKQGEIILSSDLLVNNLQNDGGGFFEIFSPSNYMKRKIIDSAGNYFTEDGVTLVFPDKNANGFYTKNHDLLGVFYQGNLHDPVFKQVTKIYDNVSLVETFDNEVWIVKISDQTHINLSEKYENIDSASLNDITGEKFAINFSDDQKSIILNTEGELVAKTDCDHIYNFENQVAKFLSKNKYGIVDSNGKVILEAQYDYISNIDDGIAVIKSNDKWYILSLQ